MKMKSIYLFLITMVIASASAHASGINVKFDTFQEAFNLGRSVDESIGYMKDLNKGEVEAYKYHYVLGTLFLGKKDYLKAAEEFKKVIELNLKNYLSYYNLGYIYFVKDNHSEKPITYLKSALKYELNDPILYNSLSYVYYIQNDFNESKDILEEGIRRIQNNEALYLNQTITLMQHYSNTDEINKVTRNMKKAIEIAPKEDYFLILGGHYLKQKNNEEAKALFERAIELFPENVYFLLGLSTTYKNVHQYKKALEIANKALKIEPDNKIIHNEIKEYEDDYKEWLKKSEKRNP